MRSTRKVAAVGVAMALSGAVAVGTGGTAEAATPQQAVAGAGSTVAMPVELAACRRAWHPGAWYWWSHTGWDRRHPWLRRWERRQHAGWWDCR
jgi:hypothetical protein